jgi:hypothetical protein
MDSRRLIRRINRFVRPKIGKSQTWSRLEERGGRNEDLALQTL